jgi:hypothetical protein
MALTEEQKKEADGYGMSYELYEALSNITIDPNALSGLNETLAQINSPAGQAELQAAIAANIGPINPLTMLGSDTIGPIYQPLTFTDNVGNTVVVNERNPTNIPQTLQALQDLEVPVVATVQERLPEDGVWKVSLCNGKEEQRQSLSTVLRPRAKLKADL